MAREGQDIHGVDWDAVNQFKGVERIKDDPTTLLIRFNFTPTDDQVQFIHALLNVTNWTP